MSLLKPVKILPQEVARKIAAGEVIDRPNAIIRELMDNAIDSGADEITVEITDGGISKIRITDNGSGMSKDDLSIAATPHATSKISTEQDLLNLSTLGFRGEALSSIASVSDLTISSGEWTLETNIIEKNKITPGQNVSGTIVCSENLFKNFPARRMFLKRSATEAKMCQNMFIEKALPFNNIDFRFYSDGELKINLPKTESLLSRFTDANSFAAQKNFFYTIKNSAKDNSWNYTLIIGDPSITRNDRKEISIFVNNRKIVEYSLLQAIEYGVTGYFPNGLHPVASLFVTISPELVDFNIHPAKKEVRFKDINELHHSVSVSVQNLFRGMAVKTVVSEAKDKTEYENTFETDFFTVPVSQERSSYRPDTSYKDSSHSSCFSDSSQKSDMRSVFLNSSSSSYHSKLAELAFQDPDSEKENPPLNIQHNDASCENKGFHYIGPCLGVFLIAEMDDTLYLVDQHAAHERILYNKIISEKPRTQKLLVPYKIETDSCAADSYLESVQEELEKCGFIIKNTADGIWEITGVHERWIGSESDLERVLLDDRVSPDKILNHIAATTACKAAVKDGYYLDEKTASDLAISALNLPDPHCPHGRPIFTAISRDRLFELVKRT